MKLAIIKEVDKKNRKRYYITKDGNIDLIYGKTDNLESIEEQYERLKNSHFEIVTSETIKEEEI